MVPLEEDFLMEQGPGLTFGVSSAGRRVEIFFTGV